MNESKALLHGKNFDVLSKLTVTLDESGKPVMEAYCKDGIPQFIKDKNGDLRQVLIPRLTLDGNVMREWFYAEYPDGRISVKRLTPNPEYDQEKHCWSYPAETVEVELYKTVDEKIPFANGYGKQNVFEGNLYPEVPSAITIAIKNAMQNAGFGIDIEWQLIQDRAQKFCEIGIGEKVDVVPIQYESIEENAHENAAKKKEPVEVVKKLEEMPEEKPSSDDLAAGIFAAIAQSATKDEDVPENDLNEEIEIDPEEVIFETSKTNWTKYNGKKLGELLKEDGFTTILLAVSDNNSRYSKFISREVIEAANKIAANF